MHQSSNVLYCLLQYSCQQVKLCKSPFFSKKKKQILFWQLQMGYTAWCLPSCLPWADSWFCSQCCHGRCCCCWWWWSSAWGSSSSPPAPWWHCPAGGSSSPKRSDWRWRAGASPSRCRFNSCLGKRLRFQFFVNFFCLHFSRIETSLLFSKKKIRHFFYVHTIASHVRVTSCCRRWVLTFSSCFFPLKVAFFCLCEEALRALHISITPLDTLAPEGRQKSSCKKRRETPSTCTTERRFNASEKGGNQPTVSRNFSDKNHISGAFFRAPSFPLHA